MNNLMMVMAIIVLVAGVNCLVFAAFGFERVANALFWVSVLTLLAGWTLTKIWQRVLRHRHRGLK
jgi:hypothetical protein